MSYTFKGPTTEITLEGRETELVRHALIIHPQGNDRSEERRTDMLLRQVKDVNQNRSDEDQFKLKVDQASCVSLSRSVEALKGESNYTDPSIQVTLIEVQGRFEATGKLLTEEAALEPGQAGASKEDAATMAVRGLPSAVPTPTDRLIARQEARAAHSGPAEPRFAGMERPFQLELPTAARSGGRGI